MPGLSPSSAKPVALVTGGAGFIGSELVYQLLGCGWQVRVLDNFATGHRENLAELAPDALTWIVGDVRDAQAVAYACTGAAVVFHLACLGVRHSLRAPMETHEVNATGALVVAQEALAARVRRLVHVSSSEVYGSAQCAPMDENHPCHPTTVYGASKLAGEAYARALHLTHGLPVVVVRPFNAFGPRCHHEGDSGEVIPKMLLRAMAGRDLTVFGDGEQTRDFTAVSDTARGILQAALASEAIGRTLNLGSGREISINALAQRILAIAGNGRARIVHQPGRPGDVRRLIADSTLAHRLLDFTPQVELEDGLRHLLRWYRARGIAPEDLLKEEQARNWEEATSEPADERMMPSMDEDQTA